MRDDRGVADKLCSVTHDLGDGWGRCDHGVGDAGELGDITWNPPTSVHQALKSVNHLTITNQGNCYFRGPVAVVGGQARRLKVQDRDRFDIHAHRNLRILVLVVVTSKPFGSNGWATMPIPIVKVLIVFGIGHRLAFALPAS